MQRWSTALLAVVWAHLQAMATIYPINQTVEDTTQRQPANRRIHVAYRIAPATGNGEGRSQWCWHYEGGADSTMQSFGTAMSRFPESDALFRLSERFRRSSQLSLGTVVLGVSGGFVSTIFALSSDQFNPAQAGLLVFCACACVQGLTCMVVFTRKKIRYWQLAADSYNKQMETGMCHTLGPVPRIELSVGLASDYPGIGLRLRF